MQILKLLGLIEEYGEDVDGMFREIEDRLLEPPLPGSADDSGDRKSGFLVSPCQRVSRVRASDAGPSRDRRDAA